MTIWANFLLLEKLFQKLVLRVSSGFPNTRKQSKHSACGLVRIWKPWWNTRTHFQNITSQYFFLGTIFVEVWKDLNCLLGALIFTLWKFLKKKYNISSGHVIHIILPILPHFMTVTFWVFASSFISIVFYKKKTEQLHARSLRVCKHEYDVLDSRVSFWKLFYKSNRALFCCLHSLV